MEAFRSVADELLARRIVDHLRKEYSNTTVQLSSGPQLVSEIAEDELIAMVLFGLSRARGYGISHESSLAGFVAIMFETAPNFDAYPLVQQILQDETIPPDSRIDLLLERVTEPDWEALKARYDTATWKMISKE